MRAIIWTAYGPPDVLRLGEAPKPEPRDNQLLIRVHAATVTAGDTETRGLSFGPWLALPMRLFMGITRPSRVTILGQELAGEVEAVGPAVTRFKPGDAVMAATGLTFGAYADYICLPEHSGDGVVVRKPGNASYAEAAALPVAGLEALHFLRKADLRPGERLLVNGAGGSIGTYAIQLARRNGVEVTAVDSAEKRPLLEELGAAHVIDYAAEDFTRNGQTYDAILDVVGKRPRRDLLASLAPGGRLLLANPGLRDLMRGSGRVGQDGKRVFAQAAGRDPADLEHLAALIEAGRLRPVIGRRFPLEQAAEAHRYVESGRKQGNVVLTVVEEAAG